MTVVHSPRPSILLKPVRHRMTATVTKSAGTAPRFGSCFPIIMPAAASGEQTGSTQTGGPGGDGSPTGSSLFAPQPATSSTSADNTTNLVPIRPRRTNLGTGCFSPGAILLAYFRHRG